MSKAEDSHDSTIYGLTMTTLGDSVISISGTSKTTGQISASGIKDITFRGGHATIKSTKDLLIENCSFCDCLIYVDMADDTPVTFHNCYLKNTKISVINNNHIHSIGNVMSQESHISRQECTPAISKPNPNNLDVWKLVNNHGSPPPQADERLFTDDEIAESISKVGVDWMSYLTEDEHAAYVKDLLTVNSSPLIGDGLRDVNIKQELDQIKNHLHSTLSCYPGTNPYKISVSQDANDPTKINVSFEITHQFTPEFLPVTIKLSSEEVPDEPPKDSGFWGAAIGAIGVAAMMALLPKKSSTKLAVQNENVLENINATV